MIAVQEGIIRFSTTESKALQETPEESYNRRNLGRVGPVHDMDKALEPIVVAALARYFSHIHVHLTHQSSQDLPFSCQKRETQNISMHFSNTASISSMSLSTVVSVPYTIMVNNQHGSDCLATVMTIDVKCQMY